MNFGTHNVGSMTRRILRQYDAATATQHEEGTRWYRDARKFCAVLAIGSDYTFMQVAYVTAVLSPQVPWDRNKIATRDAIHAHTTGTPFVYGGYGANADKAVRILDGDLTALKGPKVEAFAAAIIGDLSHVTVDVWATRAARDARTNLMRAYADDELPSIVEHRAIAEAYRRAAGHRGIEPAVMQAIVWVVVRESDQWPRPQHMTATARARFWKRQARLRAAEGLGVPYDWNGAAPTKVLAYA